MDNFFQIIPLGEVLRFGNGKSIKPGGSGRYLVYGSNGVIGGSDEYRHENGIIIGRVGAYCGSVSYCPSRFWASDNTLVAFPSSDDHDTKFLYYLLVDAKLSRHAGGAAQPLVTQGVLKQVEAKVPPLPIQRRIAGILSAYDDLIENSQRRIKILEEMARRLYREWFVYFRFPGHEGCRFVESPLGEIPEGWEVRKLRDVCRLTMGQSPKSETYNELGNGMAFHQGVSDFGNRYPTDRLFCTADGRMAEAGDILFSVRAPVGRMNIANKPIILGRGLSAIRHLQDFQAFLWEQLRNSFTKIDMIGNGAIFASVTKEDMQGIDLLCPPHPLVVAATNYIEPLHSEIATLSQQIPSLRLTRDLLLPRLLSGQIDVEALPEPVLSEL
ncbi:restriction endonuclease subunit S [Vulcanococcus limneticus]|uniref:restriction endonuclease subunit S n=1 Tax=Vulcanococcus limneticus TaxID=2170428 RepID=UPI00398BFFFD